MSRFPGRSKTEAIQEAISAYLAETAAEEIKRLAGAMEIEDVSTKLRRIDRHT